MSEKNLKKAEEESKATAVNLQVASSIIARPMGLNIEISDEEYNQLGNENKSKQQLEKEILKKNRKELVRKFNSELNLIQIKKQELTSKINKNNNEEINKQINELNNYEKKLKEDIPSLADINKYLKQSKLFNSIKNHKKIVEDIKIILNELSKQTTLEGIKNNINRLKEKLKNSNINEKLKNALINKTEEKIKNINENNKVEIMSKIVRGTNDCIIKPYELGKKSLESLIASQKIIDSRFKQILGTRPKFLLNRKQKENINGNKLGQQISEDILNKNIEISETLIEENKDIKNWKNEEIEKNDLDKAESENEINSSNTEIKIQDLKEEGNIIKKAWNFIRNAFLKIFSIRFDKASKDIQQHEVEEGRKI